MSLDWIAIVGTNVVSIVVDVKNVVLVVVKMKGKLLGYLALSFVIVVAVFLVFYFWGSFASEPVSGNLESVGSVISVEEVVDELKDVESRASGVWIDVDLKDVITGEIFRISDFDRPVVLESFAAWCPTCKKQQDQIQRLIDEGDNSVHISVNTDPNEDEARVVEHVNRYGYTWPFAVFPVDATESLVDEFGFGVVNAPRAPVILICPDGESRLLAAGVKSADDLREEIAKC
jgi:thiol-disulfide isomerase/thioredoxin